MDPIAIALSAIRIINALRKAKLEMNENQAEAKRLVDRVSLLEKGLTEITSGYRTDLSSTVIQLVILYLKLQY